MGVVFWDVIDEHLDEAEAAWERWERRLDAHDDTLAGVEGTFEERLFANLDGLDAGGAEVRERALLPALDEAEGPRRTAAAYVLAASGDAESVAAVCAKLRDEDARGDVARALGLVRGGLSDAMTPLLNDGDPEIRAAAIEVLSFRREALSPAPVGVEDAPALVAATLRAAWQSGDRGALAMARAALGSSHVGVRDAAIAVGLSLGAPEAFARCREICGGASAEVPAGSLSRPLTWLSMGGDPRDVESVLYALTLAPHRASALRALAAGGHPAGAEACLSWIEDAELGPLAADAFVAITGMPIDAGALAPPTAEDDLAPAPLPRLRRDSVLAWWQSQKGRFHRQRRYWLGQLATFDAAKSILARGPMRRRPSIAEELALRSRGRGRVETRAFASRQRDEIARIEAPSLPFEHGFSSDAAAGRASAT